MPSDDSFAELMTRLRAGDDAAAAAVFHRFATRLISLARLRLDARLRQKIDPEDVLQSVFRSFFLRHAKDRFDLNSWDDLWALLALLTVRKCCRNSARFHTDQRNIAVEVRAVGPADGAAVAGRFASDPSPAEAAMLAELVEQLLRDLGRRDGEILSLALQGYSTTEISTQLERPPRTVRRVLERIRTRLQAEPAEIAGLP